jgi:Flp pilus assembly protein TadG
VRKRTNDPRGEEGQALVELALVIPLLLFIIFAIIDFGLAINQYNNTTNLANLGARATSVLSNLSGSPSSPTCTYKGTTYTTLVGYLDCQGATEGSLSQVGVTVCDASTSTFNPGDTLQIKVSDNFNWFSILTGGIGKIGPVVSPQTSIASTASMRMEGTLTSASSSSWLSSSSQNAPNSSTAVGGPTVTTSGNC